MSEIGERTISVAICVRDGEKYIAFAIESAIHQSVKPESILVINDGSNDRSRAIALELNCEVIDLDKKGLAAARNLALSRAETDLVFFLDSDDLMEEHALRDLTTALKGAPGAVGATGMRRNFISPELMGKISVVDQRFLEREKNSLPSGSLWVRDAASVIRFNENSRTADVEWALDLRKQGARLAEAKTTVLNRRIHLDNESSKLETRMSYLALAVKNISGRA
tara:strand:- start:6381 stop:7052 length:672 start_codon:yes stop_codon:yes gene_type:complete